jgi:hypothetical protein
MYLIENLPPELWSRTVPGIPRRTVRMIAAHIHNARCMWIKMMSRTMQTWAGMAPPSWCFNRLARRGPVRHQLRWLVSRALESARPAALTRVHRGGRWLVNGSGRRIVRIQLQPAQRAT